MPPENTATNPSLVRENASNDHNDTSNAAARAIATEKQGGHISATPPEDAPPTTLKIAKGPYDGFSIAEKEMTCEFMEKVGLPTGGQSQRLYHGFLKLLFDVREAGVEYITCYRANEFKYCKTYRRTKEPSLIDTILSWRKYMGSI